MFKKILIANRGEIACRVIATARRLGIDTVAVYSDADRDALHVRLAEHAVRLGPAAAADSYLRIDRVVQACVDTGADAVHPGYGFLSENAAFATALADAGVTFIGPPPAAIDAMGDKIRSKKIALEAGVNIIPGSPDALADADQAVECARAIAYPVMLKASAGGGGKGMRVARDDRECREGFERASSEAEASFGDRRVFVEKFIESPRHIEIQVLADRYGKVLSLGERECSLQRRHQKVIEEAPSPFIGDATRETMSAQARALATAVGYESAGTVEFVVGRDEAFYFLEMNTRLQVEHPVTECVTGLDLVELMLRVAAGEPLPLEQHDLRRDGWAIEARVYAEDPTRGFLPAVGRLSRYAEPPAADGVRVDAGVVEGAEVSPHYDPMIAKLIVSGPDRAAAVAGLRDALDAFTIRGVRNNLGFLAALAAGDAFASGRFSTALIGEQYPDGFVEPAPVGDERTALLAVAAAVGLRLAERAAAIDGRLAGLAAAPVADQRVVVVDGGRYPVERVGRDRYRVGDRELGLVSDWRPGQPLFAGLLDGAPLRAQLDVADDGYTLTLRRRGAALNAQVLSPKAARYQALMPVKQPPDLSQFLLSPMPGLLSRLLVAAGDTVEAGQPLCIVEAMKMENVLRAESDGTVAELLADAGASLAVDQPILRFA